MPCARGAQARTQSRAPGSSTAAAEQRQLAGKVATVEQLASCCAAALKLARALPAPAGCWTTLEKGSWAPPTGPGRPHLGSVPPTTCSPWLWHGVAPLDFVAVMISSFEFVLFAAHIRTRLWLQVTAASSQSIIHTSSQSVSQSVSQSFMDV